MKYLQSYTTLEVQIVMTKYLQSSATQEQNDSEGSGWSQVAEVGAGDRKAKIDGLNTGDRLVHCCNRLSVVMMLTLR